MDTTSGPGSVFSATSGPPPKHGSVIAGRSLLALPGAQSSIPASLFICRSVGVSTSIFACADLRQVGSVVVGGRGAAHEQTGHEQAGHEQGSRHPSHARLSVRTSFSATTGSVGPSPYDGHHFATGQAPQAGLRE